MALPIRYTYARNESIKAIQRGELSNLRLFGLKGNMNKDQAWLRVEDAVGGRDNKSMPSYGEVPLDLFSSTCFYFGEALTRDGVSGEARPKDRTRSCFACHCSTDPTNCYAQDRLG